MVRRLRIYAQALILVLFTVLSSSLALVSKPALSPTTYARAISDLREAIVKGLGFPSEEVKISGFDTRDALVGHAVAYEFDVEIDNMVFPLKLLEDVNRWEYVDLPIFQVEEPTQHGDETGLVQMRPKSDYGPPVLAPFQLAGPMELWIQDAKDMRISLPHDVDAGVLKKVILAEGAVVTVKGARSVSLRHPIDFPLPLNRSSNKFASGLLTLAEQLRHASSSQSSPPLSLRIVGPTSLTSPSTSSSPKSRLKLKRLAPGLVELSSAVKNPELDADTALSTVDGSMTVLSLKHFAGMWPLASVNGSNPNMVGLETLLSSVLGPKANKKGSFRLLKADVSAQTFVKIGFGVEKKLKEGEIGNFPAWRTKPESVRMRFEVLAKLDGEKVVPETVMQVGADVPEDSVAQNMLTGNVTVSKLPIVHHPSNPFTL